MSQYPDYTRERLRLLVDHLRNRIYSEFRPLEPLLVSERVDRISYAEAQRLEKWRPAKLGDQFGPLFATYWFRASFTVPAEWEGRRLDLLWGTHSEGTLWIDGRSIQGLNHEPASYDGTTRPDAVLTDCAHAGQVIEFQIETACNKMFGYDANHALGFRSISPYILDRAEVGAFDPLAWETYHDFRVLQQLSAEHAGEGDKAWDGVLLTELNRFANAFDLDDRTTWAEAGTILKALFERHNGSCAHELSAIGHAHLDTAWLWPLAETERKVERTFSTAINYMNVYPEYKFAGPQAQHYAWIKKRNPDLYERVREKIKAGKFCPVGGTWVEPDCNIPSGESLARQFLQGQRFFRREFGITCREFWNPDVFGYNGQLPQICCLSGVTRFLTQKLSWNHFNKPLHHTFLWEGIDGSSVLTHFPPADTYGSEVNVSDLRRNVRQYKDADRSQCSLMLFGYGDGGGGPTKRMLETLRRVRDLQGTPRTVVRSSEEFFDILEKDCKDPVRLVGELYFEYHRGTYTTQAATKRGNRKCEFLLHDVEFLAAVARSLTSDKERHDYPSAPLETLWQMLLTEQFHDILPGSSIRLVYEDTERHHAQIAAEGAALRDAAARVVVGGVGPCVPSPGCFDENIGPIKTGQPVNTIGFERAEVVSSPNGKAVYIVAPPYGIGDHAHAPDRVTLVCNENAISLENRHLRASLAEDGTLVSLLEKATGRETLAAPGNRFLMYVDRPNHYDAWDIDPNHMEQESECEPATSCKVVEQLPLRAGVMFEREIGRASTMRQIVRLAADSRRLEFHCEVDWHESHRLLKVAFPVNVRAMNATYEMQFGSVERPTHFNTRYDIARYEVPGHKWADLSEHGFGVALLSESKYGFSTHENVMRITLLRSPKHPDPQADMGRHVFSYAIMPHAGGWREAGVVAEGYRFNAPMLFVGGAKTQPRSFFSVDDPNLVLDTVKKAEDSEAIVVRMYECHGARGTAKLKCALPFKTAKYANILEDELGDAVVAGDGCVEIPYQPYKIITVMLK